MAEYINQQHVQEGFKEEDGRATVLNYILDLEEEEAGTHNNDAEDIREAPRGKNTRLRMSTAGRPPVRYTDPGQGAKKRETGAGIPRGQPTARTNIVIA